MTNSVQTICSPAKTRMPFSATPCLDWHLGVFAERGNVETLVGRHAS